MQLHFDYQAPDLMIFTFVRKNKFPRIVKKTLKKNNICDIAGCRTITYFQASLIQSVRCCPAVGTHVRGEEGAEEQQLISGIRFVVQRSPNSGRGPADLIVLPAPRAPPGAE